ncbi:MAG: hypothetical protein ACMXYG_07710 [Candidatus Woesearchaeota archaeon]
MTHFFIVKNNEEELIKIINTFNLLDCVFLYDYDTFVKDNIIEKFKKLRIEYPVCKSLFKPGIIFNMNEIKFIPHAKKLVDFVVVPAIQNLRELIEKNRNIYVYGVENSEGYDFMHFRNSRINHVLARSASQNKIHFLFNFSDFLNLSDKNKVILLGRLKQNLSIYKKYKIKFQIMSFISNEFTVKLCFNNFQKLLESNKAELIVLSDFIK